MKEDAPSALAGNEFWKILGARAVGATIVTTIGNNGPEGFLALSATHFSASPPLMTVAASRKTSALKPIVERKVFAINFLSRKGREIFDRFASPQAAKGSARFESLQWDSLETGAPAFACVTGVIDCLLDDYIKRDETYLLFGRVIAARHNEGEQPLIYFNGAVQS